MFRTGGPLSHRRRDVESRLSEVLEIRSNSAVLLLENSTIDGIHQYLTIERL